MQNSRRNKKGNGKAAGKSEQKLRSGKVIDSMSPKRATEIERSGSASGISKAIDRLKESKKSQQTLKVPQKDLSKAAKVAQKKNFRGSIANISGTKRRSVKKK